MPNFGKVTVRLSVSAIALTTAILPAAVHAQTAGAPAAPPSRSDALAASTPTDGIADIIVTANKRSQSVQKIPGAVTGVSADQLAFRGVQSLDDISKVAPGLTFYSQSGSPFITLRGVGVPVDTGASDPNTAVNVDGVNLPRAGMQVLDLFDLERVEVARGPQGTLYGRNAIGGAINFISKRPTDTLTGKLTVGGGNYQSYLVRGAISGPVSDSIRVRLSGSRNYRGKGFVRNLQPGQRSVDQLQDWSVRGAAEIDLAPNFRADISAQTYFAKTDAYQQLMAGINYIPFSPRNPPGSGGSIAVIDAPGATYSTKPWEVYSNFVHFSHKRVSIFNGTLTWDIAPNIHAKSITGAVLYKFHYSLDGNAVVPLSGILPSPSQGALYGDTQPSKYYSQEFNLGGEFGTGGAWVVGSFLSHESYRVDIPYYFNTGGFSTIASGDPFLGVNAAVNNNTYYVETTAAVFADATVPITDRFRAYAGARYAQERNKARADYGFTIFAPNAAVNPQGVFTAPDGCAALTGGAVPNQTYDFHWNPFTPRVGAQLDVADRVTTYAQYSRGFKVGGTAASLCGNTYKPEHLDSYEAGIKSTLLDGHLVANLSVYRYDYSGLQIYQGLGSATAQVVNADARTYGVDAEITARFNSFLSADISGSYLHDRFTNFASVDATDPLNQRGLPTILVNGIPTPDLKGNRLPGVPDYNFIGGVQGSVPMAMGLFDKATLRLEGNFVGKLDVLEWERPETLQKAYVKFNAVFTLSSLDSGWNLRVWGRNLTNKATTYHFLFNGGLDIFSGQYQPPRTFGFELSKSF